MNEKEIINLFAENLRVERARKAYTQEFLAEKANISPEYLSRLEKGKYNPTICVVVNLAIALNIGIDKLLPVEKINS
ncbi:MAG: helix-turn-helix transcriptional regulator [Cyanobacteria bacterium SIG26]|nr:helix-turn-helix transcriptional regulator [Cyanobacteria bacterium SIG26]